MGFAADVAAVDLLRCNGETAAAAALLFDHQAGLAEPRHEPLPPPAAPAHSAALPLVFAARVERWSSSYLRKHEVCQVCLPTSPLAGHGHL